MEWEQMSRNHQQDDTPRGYREPRQMRTATASYHPRHRAVKQVQMKNADDGQK